MHNKENGEMNKLRKKRKKVIYFYVHFVQIMLLCHLARVYIKKSNISEIIYNKHISFILYIKKIK